MPALVMKETNCTSENENMKRKYQIKYPSRENKLLEMLE